MSESLQIALKFENLVGRLLAANGLEVQTRTPEGMDRGFDFWVAQEKKQWLVEVKYYRTARPQLSLIESAAIRLVNTIGTSELNGMLVVASHLGYGYKEVLEKKFGLLLLDRADLFFLASKTPELLDELSSLLEEPDYDQYMLLPTRDLREIIRVIPISPSKPIDTTGSDLCNELRLLKRGKVSWSDYEKLCDKILKYLFPNDLHGWHTQKRTDDGLNRFDYVCRIKPATDFWSFLIDHLNSRYIIFEFKNYTGKIKQGQILTTEKYLLENGLRRVAIIFSRAGADDNAIKMTQGAMRENGKLMLILDDDKVCKMLHMKEKGEDPTDLLFEIADDFLLSLPR